MPVHCEPVAEEQIKIYKLNSLPSVLDVGCGKAYLLYEKKLLLPRLKVFGFDISKHGIVAAKKK